MYQEEFKSNRGLAGPDFKKQRGLLLPVVAVIVTTPKPWNGVVAQMEHELYAMPAVYTMRS
ncbi:hypothetical protein BJY00DRAFT_314293 [Aspergillus carlsbadensis]|nr:hypothetical protein BJY00DRAFT_314293 [Aspergillus carlsbadensis]